MAARNPSSYTCSIDNKMALKLTKSPSFTPRVPTLHLKSFVYFSWMMLTSCRICLHPDTLENYDLMLNIKPILCSFTITWWTCNNTRLANLSPPLSSKSSSTMSPVNKKNKYKYLALDYYKLHIRTMKPTYQKMGGAKVETNNLYGYYTLTMNILPTFTHGKP